MKNFVFHQNNVRIELFVCKDRAFSEINFLKKKPQYCLHKAQAAIMIFFPQNEVATSCTA